MFRLMLRTLAPPVVAAQSVARITFRSRASPEAPPPVPLETITAPGATPRFEASWLAIAPATHVGWSKRSVGV